MKVLIGNLLISFVLVELFSMLYLTVCQKDLLEIEVDPTYLSASLEDQFDFRPDPGGPHLIDTLYPWTTWHPKNSDFRQVGPCFDVLMHYNELGSRGRLPDPEDNATVVFLGDSFIEGFGLEEDSIAAGRFSQCLGLPVLNLGCSSLGTTQMSLLYEHFSKQFRHHAVMTFLFLENDFEDNDRLRFETDRFKPFRNLEECEYGAIAYTGDPLSSKWSWAAFEHQRNTHFKRVKRLGIKSVLSQSPERKMECFLNLFYSRRLFGFILSSFKGNQNLPQEIDHSDDDWKILLMDIEAISKTALGRGARPFFTNLPSKIAVEYLRAAPENLAAYQQFESELQQAVAERGGQYFSFLSFLIDRKTDPNQLFFDCDNHYSNYGNELLTEFAVQIEQEFGCGFRHPSRRPF